MGNLVNREATYLPSDNIVAREIEGETIIVPLVSGVGDLEGEIYTLNATGKAVWAKLNGSRTVGDVIDELSVEYSAPESQIETDVMGLMQELVQRKMVDVAKST